MTQQHPITPPPELVDQWRAMPEYADISQKLFLISITTNKLQDIATQAARWGADQELGACCSWADATGWCGAGDTLRAARRSKTLSKKERALDSLLKCYAFIDDDLYNEIKEAIQSLPDEQ